MQQQQQQQQQAQHSASKDRVALKTKDANERGQTAEQKFAEVQAIARNLFVQHNQDLTQVASRQELAHDMAQRLADAKADLTEAGACKSELEAAAEALTERIRQRLAKVQTGEDACAKLAQRAEQIQAITKVIAPALLAKADAFMASAADPNSKMSLELRRVRGLLQGKSHAEWRAMGGEWRRRIVLLNTWLASVRAQQELPADLGATVASWGSTTHLPVDVLHAPLPSARGPCAVPSYEDWLPNPEDAFAPALAEFNASVDAIAGSSLQLNVEDPDKWTGLVNQLRAAFDEQRREASVLQETSTAAERADSDLQAMTDQLEALSVSTAAVVASNETESSAFDGVAQQLASLAALISAEETAIAILLAQEEERTVALAGVNETFAHISIIDRELDEVAEQVAAAARKVAATEAQLCRLSVALDSNANDQARLQNDRCSTVHALDTVSALLREVQDVVFTVSRFVRASDFTSAACLHAARTLDEWLTHPVVRSWLGSSVDCLEAQHQADADAIAAQVLALQTELTRWSTGNAVHELRIAQLQSSLHMTLMALFGYATA